MDKSQKSLTTTSLCIVQAHMKENFDQVVKMKGQVEKSLWTITTIIIIFATPHHHNHHQHHHNFSTSHLPGDDSDVPVPFQAGRVDLASHSGLRLPQPLHWRDRIYCECFKTVNTYLCDGKYFFSHVVLETPKRNILAVVYKSSFAGVYKFTSQVQLSIRRGRGRRWS